MSTATRLLRDLWRILGSTQLVAVLLAALLLASLFASLLPQMPVDPAAREPWLAAVTLRYGHATNLLHTLGLFDAYHAPWFLALLAALLLNTLICTLQRLPRLWQALAKTPQVIRPEAFYRGFAHRAEWPVSSLQEALAAAQIVLARRRYRLHVEHDERAPLTSLYAERGRWAQAGTLLSHTASLLLLIAVLAHPALSWQESGVTLLPGQTHPVGHGHGFAVQAGSLTIDYHPGGQPRNYAVPLTALVDATPVMSQTARLNHPLTVRGVSFHLQSYGPAAQLTTPEGTFNLVFAGSQAQEVTLPEAGLTLRVAYRTASGDPDEKGVALFVEALAADGTLLGSGMVPDGQEIEVQGTPVTFSQGHYTDWQVSHDPTFGLAVLSAGLLLAGMLVSLWVPHRRLWLRIDGQKAQMVGTGDLDDHFEAMAGEMAQACPPGEAADG